MNFGDIETLVALYAVDTIGISRTHYYCRGILLKHLATYRAFDTTTESQANDGIGKECRSLQFYSINVMQVRARFCPGFDSCAAVCDKSTARLFCSGLGFEKDCLGCLRNRKFRIDVFTEEWSGRGVHITRLLCKATSRKA